MAKNPRRQMSTTQAPAQPAEKKSLLSKRGKKVIGTGIGVVVLGYWILTFTDPAGQNWASTLSPALLVLGYALIGIGIVVPDPTSPPVAS